jgi:hypothetical protein
VSATVLNMSMSLDGFVAGPNEGPDNPMGDGGYRLHEWFLPGADADHKDAGRLEGINGQVLGELMATGAVVTGRRTFEMADGWGGDHHDGVTTCTTGSSAEVSVVLLQTSTAATAGEHGLRFPCLSHVHPVRPLNGRRAKGIVKTWGLACHDEVARPGAGKGRVCRFRIWRRRGPARPDGTH